MDTRTRLNEAQRRFVDVGDGPVLAIAGAGTGKTRALVARTARLVRAGVDPECLAVFTFTLRAAGELVERLASTGITNARSVRAGTFHAEAARAIRQHPVAAGVDPDFRLADTAASLDLMDRAIKDSLAPGVISAERACELYSTCARSRLWPDTIVADPALAKALPELFSAYAAQKRIRGALDFDDLLLLWHTVIAHDPVYRSTFDYVLVDEYQDVNPLQAAILDDLCADHRNLAVVGDDSQAIYGFRGADLAPMRTFRTRYPDATVLVFTQNYRCRPQILRLANDSIAQNLDRFPKVLQPARSDGRLPVLAVCANPSEEAGFVAARCQDLVTAGVPHTSLAILHRANWQCDELVAALTDRGLPIASSEHGAFFAARHIQDCLAVIRCLATPDEPGAIRRALAALPGVGDRTAGRFSQAHTCGDPAATTLARCLSKLRLHKGARHSIEQFVQAAMAWGRAPHRPMDTIEDVRTWSCFVQRWSDPHIATDLRALTSMARHTDSLIEFLDHIALLRLQGEEPGGDPGITLSTVHRAKGLEWDVVFVTGLAEGRFPAVYDNVEEERRLFHVAVTRARDQLYLTCPRGAPTRDGHFRALAPSTFLSEIGWVAGGPGAGTLFDPWLIATGE
jgi:DNA helicase-2/ATP-dependent DNA helicase PcrA